MRNPKAKHFSVLFYLSVYKLQQFFSAVHMKGRKNIGNDMFHSIDRDAHTICNLLISPVPAGQHGNGKFVSAHPLHSVRISGYEASSSHD